MCMVVFIKRTNNGDTIMRGVLANLATAQLGLRCASALITVGWYADLLRLQVTLERAFEGRAKPWACYFVKEAWTPEHDICHRAGAYSLFDVIDNDKRSGVFPSTRQALGMPS